MTFTLSGSVITQTGTDTSLAGLSGISGVTVSGQSVGKFRYLLTGRQLVINGALIIDPEVETLEFDSTTALPNLQYNKRFQIGRKRATAGEVTTVATTTATGLDGKYFTFHDGTTSFYVWFTVNGVGSNPNPGGTGILCALAGTDTNAQVATKIQDAILQKTTAPIVLANIDVSSNVVTISNENNVTATASSAGTSGFTVTRVQAGSTNGVNRYSDGDALIFSRLGTNWAGDPGIVSLVDNALFLGYGGRIHSGLAIILCGGSTTASSWGSAGRVGIVIIEKLHFFARIATSVPGGPPAVVQVRFQQLAGSTVTVSGFTFDCDAATLPDTPGVVLFRWVAPNFFSAIFKSYQLQNIAQLQAPTGDFTFDDLVFADNFRPYDIVGNYKLSFGPLIPVWTLRNTDVGTGTRVIANSAALIDGGRLNMIFTETVRANLRDASNNPITSDTLIWLTETDDGQRFNPVSRTGFDWTTVQTYNQSVDGSGVATTSVRLGIAYVSQGTPIIELRSYFGKSSADDFDIYAIGYRYNIASGSHILRGNSGYTYTQSMVTDLSISQTNRATVDAYSTINTPQQFYDRAKSWLVANYTGQTSVLVTRSGNTIDAGARDVVIDAAAASAFAVAGNTITINSAAFVGNLTTTGLITLANGATFTGARTDSTGTITSATFTITDIISGSRLLIRRTDTNVALVNQIVSGTSYVYSYLHQTNIPIEVVIRNATIPPAYQEWRTTSTLTAAGGTAAANQILDE